MKFWLQLYNVIVKAARWIVTGHPQSLNCKTPVMPYSQKSLMVMTPFSWGYAISVKLCNIMKHWLDSAAHFWLSQAETTQVKEYSCHQGWLGKKLNLAEERIWNESHYIKTRFFYSSKTLPLAVGLIWTLKPHSMLHNAEFRLKKVEIQLILRRY